MTDLAPTQTAELNTTRRQRTNHFNNLLRMANTLTAAAHARLGPPITAESRRAPKDVRALRLPKQEFPKFSGQLRDYPTFKDDWKQQIGSALPDDEQIIEVRKCVPASAKSDVSNINTMADFWRFMDDEYGKITEISCDRISYLQNFAYSRDAMTVAQKFRDVCLF